MRRLLLPLALASLLGLTASTALAAAREGAEKAQIFGPNIFAKCDTGAFPTSKTFGFVVLDTPGNDTTLSGEVALKHAKANTTYEVADQQDPGNCESLPVTVGTIMTNKKGNGNLHFTDLRIPTATEFFVIIFNSVTEELYGSRAVELD